MPLDSNSRPVQAVRKARQKAGMPHKWLAYERGWEKGSFKPDRFYIESTNVCNLDCIMCPIGLHVDTRKKGFMEWDLYKSIVDEIKGFATTCTLHAWGEPLLHPRIFDMIAYAHEAGLWTETSTNLTKLDEDAADKIIDAGLSQIYLSLDGVTKETYEKVRRKADFENSVQNVEHFLSRIQERNANIVTNLQIIRLKETHEEVQKFVDRWGDSTATRISIKELDTWGDQVERISELAVTKQDLEVARAVNQQRRPCGNLWYHCHIHWDGTIVSCSRDYDATYPMENVKDGVIKAWHGDRMQAIRRMHVEGDFCAPACQRCTEWSWWHPSPTSGGGTGGKVNKVPTGISRFVGAGSARRKEQEARAAREATEADAADAPAEAEQTTGAAAE